MANKKLIFFDIDGTIWDVKNFIPQSTKEAIRLLRQNGHQTFICSGRARGYIFNPELFALGFDGVISACGTMIEYNDEVIFNKIIDNDRMAHALEVVRAFGFKPILEGKDCLYLEVEEFKDDLYYKKLKRDMGDKILSIEEHKNSWDVFKFSCDTTGCDTKSCFRELEDEYDFLVHNENVVEIVPKGFDKSVGIEMLSKHLGVDIKDTIAIGDSVNDVGMLKRAGVGIAMGNAPESVKSVADYVTAPLLEDGIYKACDHFGLL